MLRIHTNKNVQMTQDRFKKHIFNMTNQGQKAANRCKIDKLKKASKKEKENRQPQDKRKN